MKDDKENQKKKAKKNKKVYRCNFLFDFVKVTGALSALCYIRPKILYESKLAKKKVKGRAVVISNHIGALDPLFLICVFYYRRPHFIALQDIFGSKFGNWFFTRMHCIPVNRENFEMSTFRASIDVLQREKMLVIFPEGKINEEPDNQTVAPFKSGAIMMAACGKAPIVPVFLVQRKKWWHRSICVVGEPIDVVSETKSAFNHETVNNLSEQLRQKEIVLKGIYDLWKTKKSSK